MSPPSAIIVGCSGTELSADEAAFIADAKPFGIILFQRNCETPDQVRRLTGQLRTVAGRDDLAILIDQEGGRVQRMKPPHWRQAPAAAAFGRLAERNADAARKAVRLNAFLLGAELKASGINVDCIPCLDVRDRAGHDVIGDRSFSSDTEIVADLGRMQADGLAAAGVLPVMKHLPGHGRAATDSHCGLPVVDASRQELEARDFLPFRRLKDLPLAMTAHVVYPAIDGDRAATESPSVIRDIIRRHIDFRGLLMTDDLNMQALSGSVAERAQRAWQAGCDLALHCNGNLEEMRALAAVAPPVTEDHLKRWEKALSAVTNVPIEVDEAAMLTELKELLSDTE